MLITQSILANKHSQSICHTSMHLICTTDTPLVCGTHESHLLKFIYGNICAYSVYDLYNNNNNVKLSKTQHQLLYVADSDTASQIQSTLEFVHFLHSATIVDFYGVLTSSFCSCLSSVQYTLQHNRDKLCLDCPVKNYNSWLAVLCNLHK